MNGSDDLYGVYRAGGAGKRRRLTGEGYVAALIADVRQAFLVVERLTGEVSAALKPTGYTIRLDTAVEDRVDHVRVDRTSEAFVDYLRNWSRMRAENSHLGMHWEARLSVTDHRRNTAEIGLAVTVERPGEDPGADIAFVEFWTTGKGMPLPSGRSDFHRALIGSIVGLEDAGVLKSQQPRSD